MFDEPPVLEDGCVFAPYEAVFEALGAEALWLEEEEAIAAQKGSTLVVMLSGTDRFIKEVDNDGGVIYHMDAAPVISGGSVLVPVEAAAQAFDYWVDWNEDTQTMAVSSLKWTEGQNSPTNAYIDNGVIYYAFIYQPYIYAYDGTSTETYAAGGTPLGITVSRNHIYYINESNQSIYSISLADGTREVVFSELSRISDFAICGGKMVVIGKDSEENQFAYRVDLENGDCEILYIRMKPDYLIRESGSQFAFWKENLIVVEGVSPLTQTGELHCKVLFIDTDTGESREAFDIAGSVKKLGTTRSRYVNRLSSVSVKLEDESVWFRFVLSRNDIASNKAKSYYQYYRVDLESGLAEEIDEEAYNGARDLASGPVNGWTYGNNSSEVYRTDAESGITETLLTGGNYYYITNDADQVVVLKAESEGGTPASTEDYKYAELYVMDSDGNHLRMIHSYGSQTDSSSADGSGSENLTPESCEVCGGSGMVRCSYCGGTGQGQTILVLGMPTKQSCTYCGGTGQRLCSGFAAAAADPGRNKRKEMRRSRLLLLESGRLLLIS